MLIYVFPISQTGSSRFGSIAVQQRNILETLAYKSHGCFPMEAETSREDSLDMVFLV